MWGLQRGKNNTFMYTFGAKTWPQIGSVHTRKHFGLIILRLIENGLILKKSVLKVPSKKQHRIREPVIQSAVVATICM